MITDANGRPLADDADNTVAPRPSGPWDANLNMPLINEAIARTEAELHAKGQWTRKRWLALPATADNPLLRIDYGAVLSDGTREAKIGTATIYRDGRVVRSQHL